MPACAPAVITSLLVVTAVNAVKSTVALVNVAVDVEPTAVSTPSAPVELAIVAPVSASINLKAIEAAVVNGANGGESLAVNVATPAVTELISNVP